MRVRLSACDSKPYSSPLSPSALFILAVSALTRAVFYDGTCGALGSITLANLLPSYVYQLSAHGNVCWGAACFGPTHAIIAVLCTFGSCAAAVVSVRSRSLYRQIAEGAASMALL